MILYSTGFITAQQSLSGKETFVHHLIHIKLKNQWLWWFMKSMAVRVFSH